MAKTTIIVGYLPAILHAVDRSEPDGSVVFVETAEVLAHRELGRTLMERSSVVRELIEHDYQPRGAADTFYNQHRALDVAAVIPAVEYAVPFAARLAERYGTPGAGYGAAESLRDKSQLRTVSAAAGVANPASELVAGLDEVRDFHRRYPGPVILKPANRQAAVGTRIVRDAAEFDDAWAEATVHDEGIWAPHAGIPLRMLVEQFVDGPEYSVEALVEQGTTRFVNVTTTMLYPGSRPVELGHVVPADIPDGLAAELRVATERVAGAVGFDTGVLHCEWIVSAGVPYLVECAGRMPGDGIVELIDHAWSIDVTRHYFRLMQGEGCGSMPAAPSAAAVVMYPPVEQGVVESVSGADEANAVPGVYQAGYVVGPGARIGQVRSSWDRVVGAAACRPTHAEALRATRTALELMTIKVTPDAG